MPAFSVVAIVSAFNEADIIGACLESLIAEGVQAYLLDHRSTDDTVECASAYLGRGLLHIETFPVNPADKDSGRYSVAAIMRRKSELAAELDGDWFIHHDADEFRESPWADCSLKDAIFEVDRAGWNAIDFELLNFWPADDTFRRGQDPRELMPHYTQGETHSLLQVRCWKRLPDVMVDLASSAGHDVSFAGRRVFPIRFLLRHYPFRTLEQARRKVLEERLPRFDPSERARGWHVQYDHLESAQFAIPRTDHLPLFEPRAARTMLAVRNRELEQLEQQHRKLVERVAQQTAHLDTLYSELANVQQCAALVDALYREVEMAREARRRADTLAFGRGAAINELEVLRPAQDRGSSLGAAISEATHALADTRACLTGTTDVLTNTRLDLEEAWKVADEMRRERDAVYASRTWRWSAFVRTTLGRLFP